MSAILNYKKMRNLLILLFLSINCFGQDIVKTFELKLKSNKDVFQIVDENTGDVNFFVSDRKKIMAFNLNKSLEIKDSLSAPRPERRYKDILGYASENHRHFIYWTTTNKEDVYVQEFDFQKRQLRSIPLNLTITSDEENYLESFTTNGKFYIIRLNNKDKQLYLYEIFGESVSRHILNTKEMSLYLTDNFKSNIYNIFADNDFDHNPFDSNFEKEMTISKINLKSPTTLADSAKKRKMYIIGGNVYISFDNTNTKTQLIKVDLQTKTCQLIDIPKPVIENSDTTLTTNSFLIDDKIFQIAVTAKKIVLVEKDLVGNIIKQHSVNDKDIFTIKNSPFTRERISGSERELETTAQFLRKIVRSNVGISVYKVYDNYLMTIGCISAESSGGGAPMMGMGGFGMPMGGSTMMMPIPANFMMMSYNSYKGRRSIATKSLFNKDFTHISGELKDLAFDKIKKFEDDYMGISSLKLQTIFRQGTDYIFGCYDEDLEQYSFRKYTD